MAATAEVTLTQVELAKIVSNTGQSRGMGVLSRLKILGHGLFDRASMDADKKPIWPLLMSAKPEDRKEAVELIETHEPEIARLGEQLSVRQLEPVGVRPVKDGYDVIFGMRRTIARAYWRAKKGSSAPDTIEAKVFPAKMSDVELLLMGLEENDHEEESALDRALTYQRLRKEGKLDYDEIGKRTRQSHQTIRNYVLLLDPKLEDKRLDIHSGAMSVDRALKLLKSRKEKPDAEDARSGASQENRHRLPSVKGIQKIYEAKAKPKGMTDKEWELWTDPQVRKFLAYKLGFKFREFVPAPAEAAEPAKAKTNGQAKKGAAASAGTPAAPAAGKFRVSISRETANRLLIDLGKANARAWSDAEVAEKLAAIPNVAEKGQKVSEPKLQALLDTLWANYAKGIEVVFVQPKAKK